MAKNIFSEVEKQADSAWGARASWRGVLSLNIPTLGLGAVEYHLRAAKAHGDLQPVSFVKIDKKTGKEVVSREVPVIYRYKEGPGGERLDVEEITPDEAKKHVRYDGKYQISVRNEKRFFLKNELEMSGEVGRGPPRPDHRQAGRGGDRALRQDDQDRGRDGRVRAPREALGVQVQGGIPARARHGQEGQGDRREGQAAREVPAPEGHRAGLVLLLGAGATSSTRASSIPTRGRTAGSGC